MEPKITIGLTCYEAKLTIASAIESAMAQNYPDFEIIVVDDCSTDGSFDFLTHLAKDQNGKIRVFQNSKNLGVAGSRNKIISEAKGDFLCFFDDDDVSRPDRIWRQMQRIVEYEHDFSKDMPVICHTARLQKYPDGSERIAPTMGCDIAVVAPHGKDMAGRILYNKKIRGGHGAMPTCSQMARVSTYKALGGFDESFRRMEDTEFNLRLALAGGHFVGISDPLVTQTMTLASDKHIAGERIYARRMYEKHKEFLLEEGRGQFDLAWLDLKHDYWEGFYLKFVWHLIFLVAQYPILSMKRALRSLPNMGYNTALRRLHQRSVT